MLIAKKRLCIASFIAISFSCVIWHTASARDVHAKDSSQVPLQIKSHLGSYLAGQLASSLNDTSLAVRFYRQALQFAPRQSHIMTRTFLMEAIEGNITAADKIALQVLAAQPNHSLTHLWLGAAEFRANRYKVADQHFKRVGQDPIGKLTSQLALAWVALARNKKRQALSQLKLSQKRTWSDYYRQYHRALIADLSHSPSQAFKAYRNIFKLDVRTPRVSAAYIRHALKRGKYALAGQIARKHIQTSTVGGHATIISLFADIKAKRSAELIVQTPREGLAEVFYVLGEALAVEGSLNLGKFYLQMALALKPDFPMALTALASAYEATRDYARAIKVYDSIRDSTVLDAEISMRKAINFDADGKTDKAKQILDEVIASHPLNTRPLEVTANILRNRKRYREAIDYYSRLIRLLPSSEKRHWVIWYNRGTSYERIQQWPNAEKDLLKAMELDPDQALILNYLGYSWVDQNIHLRRGLKMIEKAVSLEPNDGYMVDSLGWAHYRLGNFGKAVTYLERAVELQPEDPTLNDHLGDALWQAKRWREARYQWELALTMKPKEEDVVKIRKKIIHGLPPYSDLKTDDGGKKKTVVPTKTENGVYNNVKYRQPVR